MTLTRNELIRLNKQLAARGRRICPCCGAQHELTADYWYFNPSNGRVRSNCKQCERVLAKLPARRQQQREYYATYYADPERLEKKRASARRRRRSYTEQKRARLAAVLNTMNARREPLEGRDRTS